MGRKEIFVWIEWKVFKNRTYNKIKHSLLTRKGYKKIEYEKIKHLIDIEKDSYFIRDNEQNADSDYNGNPKAIRKIKGFSKKQRN